MSTYSDLGLDLLEEILTNVNKNVQVSNEFYVRYHMRMLTEIMDVMTDGFHKNGLRTQMKIFFILVHVTTQNVVIIFVFRLLTRYPETNLLTCLTVNFFITF